MDQGCKISTARLKIGTRRYESELLGSSFALVRNTSRNFPILGNFVQKEEK